MMPKPPANARTGSDERRRRSRRNLTVLHIDDDLIVVDKPTGILSAPGRGNAQTAADLVREQVDLGGNDALRIVHRLDQDASGVLVYARTLKAQQSLVRQFSRREVKKAYFAIVTGYVESDGQIDSPLTYDRRSHRVRVGTRGKPALTHYRIAERLAGNTLLECHPVTGRSHQIRVHLASIGHHLTVDPLYGGGQAVLLSHFKPGYKPNARRPERPLIDRLTLHAVRIQFTHPATGDELTLEAALPKDMRATVNQLRRLI